MSAMTRIQLWQRLRDQALVEGDLPPAQGALSPWYVRVMLGVAGWIGALFLLGFVGAAFAFVMRSAAASMTIGALCCAGAYLVFRAARDNDFGTQFGLAASLAGQALFISGLFNAFRSDAPLAYFIACAFEVVLAVLLPNFIHRVLSSWAAMIALSFALGRIGLHGIAPGIAAAGIVLIWLNELRWITNDAVWRPIGYGLVLALLQIDAMSLSGHVGWFIAMPDKAGWLYLHAPQIGSALVAAVLMMTVLRLLAQQGVALASRTGMAAIVAAIALAAVSFFAPGMASAFLVLLLGFAAGNRVLIGLGLLALGGFLSHYYYQMQTTLLVKSMVLAASGTMLLGARVMLQKWLAPAANEEKIDA